MQSRRRVRIQLARVKRAEVWKMYGERGKNAYEDEEGEGVYRRASNRDEFSDRVSIEFRLKPYAMHRKPEKQTM